MELAKLLAEFEGRPEAEIIRDALFTYLSFRSLGWRKVLELEASDFEGGPEYSQAAVERLVEKLEAAVASGRRAPTTEELKAGLRSR